MSRYRLKSKFFIFLLAMRKSNLILFPLLLVLYELATYLSTDAYLPALPRIIADLATTPHLAQLTLTTWFLGSASMQLVMGSVTDHCGRRPVLLVGGVVFVIATIICAITANIYVLLIFRFFQGATIASMVVSGYATIHELFDRERAIHVLAWMYSVTVLAPAFGPLFGVVLLYIVSWRGVFGILAVWAALVIIALFLNMPETGKVQEKNWRFKAVLGQYWRIFTNFQYLRNTLGFCILFCAMIAWITASPFLIITEFHHSTFYFGVIQGLVFGSYIIGMQLVKPMMRKYQIPFLIKVGLTTAMLGGVAAFLLAWLLPQTLAAMIISMVLINAGTGFCSPMFNRLAMEASNEPMGTRVAVFTSLMSMFGVIGSAFVSGVYNGKLFSLAIILAVLSVIAFALRWHRAEAKF